MFADGAGSTNVVKVAAQMWSKQRRAPAVMVSLATQASSFDDMIGLCATDARTRIRAPLALDRGPVKCC